jgi:hypothetical protein
MKVRVPSTSREARALRRFLSKTGSPFGAHIRAAPLIFFGIRISCFRHADFPEPRISGVCMIAGGKGCYQQLLVNTPWRQAGAIPACRVWAQLSRGRPPRCGRRNHAPGGGNTPSSIIKPSVSMIMRVSFMRPPFSLSITTPQTRTGRPVSGTPRNYC